MAALIDHKTAKIEYKFSDDKTGSLTEPKLEISVQFRGKKNDFSHEIELSSNHKHHLPTMFIHVDGNKGEQPEPNISVHPKPQKTLKEYFDWLKNTGVKPVMLYNRFINQGSGGAAAAGDGGGGAAGYYYVPNEVRAIVKAIISALLYLHRKQGSLSGPLTWNNFVIYDDYLALRNASYREKNEETRNEDLDYVHEFIAKNIFVDSEDPIPPVPADMADLLNNLLADPSQKNSFKNKPDRSKLMGYHFATMSHSERISFMINCWDKEGIICSESSNRYSGAITNLNPQPEWKWKDDVGKSKFSIIVKPCYEKGKYPDKADNEDHIDKRNALRCCRNLATHLKEEIENHFKSSTDNHDKSYAAKDIDIIVSSIFAPMLVDFSRALMDENALEDVITWMEEDKTMRRFLEKK